MIKYLVFNTVTREYYVAGCCSFTPKITSAKLYQRDNDALYRRDKLNWRRNNWIVIPVEVTLSIIEDTEIV